MGYWQCDDRSDEHPKFIGLSSDAIVLWWRGRNWASRNWEQNGLIPEAWVQRGVPPVQDIESALQELLDVGLWHRVAAGFEIHDYLEHARSADEIRERRDKDAERKRKARVKTSPPADRPESVRPDSTGSPPGVQTPESDTDTESVSQSSDRLTTLPVDNPLTDDEVDLQRVDQVAAAVVELRFARQTNVRNPGSWRKRCRQNLVTDDDGAWWARMTDLVHRHQPDTPISLLAAAADGAPSPTLAHWRTKEPA